MSSPLAPPATRKRRRPRATLFLFAADPGEEIRDEVYETIRRLPPATWLRGVPSEHKSQSGVRFVVAPLKPDVYSITVVR